MAAITPLSKRDIDVLEKIRDPESNPADAVRLDSSLPMDPHVTSPAVYGRVTQTERDLILVMQLAEMELVGIKPKSLASPIDTYRQSIAGLSTLIDQYPQYASARNNRVQALRRLYGDDLLLVRGASSDGVDDSQPQVSGSTALLRNEVDNEEERAQAIEMVLSDLDRAISLLLPSSQSGTSAISPTAAKTLSLVFTQRAAIYYATAKRIHAKRPVLRQMADTCHKRLSHWSKLDFEEAASRDFTMGGRFGNEIARGLAVGTNPTAKLCGQMVQQMMKNEYGT